MILLLAVLLVLSVPVLVNAQACPPGQVQCDGDCQAPAPSASCQEGDKIGTTDTCGECTNLQCPGNQIDCDGDCQAQAAQCPPNSNRTYDQCDGCGGCATGFTDCNTGGGFDCKATDNPACASPATWDPCAGPQGTCTENYVRVSPAQSQSGSINIQGDLRTSQGNLVLAGNGNNQGDIYLNSGKAIRVDGGGATELNIGNWLDANGDGQVDNGVLGVNVTIWGDLSVGDPDFLRNLTVSGNLTVGGNITGNLAWSNLSGFPDACEDGSFVTGIGGLLTCDAPPAQGVGGSGTANRLAKFTAAATLGNSLISESGTTVTVGGTLSATGCFGPVFREASASPSQGSAGGYGGANAQCGAGRHVCTTDEIIMSIHCGVQLPANGSFWVVEGPPGYTAPAGDCQGWTSASGSHFGTYWDFGQGVGGRGIMTICTSQLPFACCQ